VPRIYYCYVSKSGTFRYMCRRSIRQVSRVRYSLAECQSEISPIRRLRSRTSIELAHYRCARSKAFLSRFFSGRRNIPGVPGGQGDARYDRGNKSAAMMNRRSGSRHERATKHVVKYPVDRPPDLRIVRLSRTREGIRVRLCNADYRSLLLIA